MTTHKKSLKLPLPKLFNGIAGIRIPEGHNDDIPEGVTCDSREVRPGYLFAAFKGAKVDGGQFIEKAIASGAKVIVCDTDTIVPEAQGVCVIRHQNPRRVFSLIAARFYHQQPQTIAAVTGTNGKTSTVHFCRELWHLIGKHSASVGTVGIIDSKGSYHYESSQSLTTPDPVKLHKALQDLVHEGVTHLAMEASSHGLHQCRLDGVRVKIGAFTNLSRDHLDYHNTLDEYLSAKLRLFNEVMEPGGIAVINADVPQFQAIASLCEARKHQVLSFGRKVSDVRLLDIISIATGQRMVFEVLKKKYTVDTTLIGEFQIYNLLCAIGIMLASGVQIETLIPVLSKVTSVPGRMERVTEPGKQPEVFVDYAHTPDALEKALNVLKPHTKGRLWVVFGCGGDRDKGKRPQMGAVACRLADMVIVTDDNPRTEHADTIRAEILKGCHRQVQEIGDRREAIATAVRQLEQNDVLLLAGKGHEKTQIIGTVTLPFDDVQIAKEFING